MNEIITEQEITQELSRNAHIAKPLFYDAEMVRLSADLVNKAVSIRTAMRVFGLERNQDGLLLLSTDLTVPGKDLAAHITDKATHVAVLGATLGGELDRALALCSQGKNALAYLMDVGANLLIEKVLDAAEAELLPSSFRPTAPRFSAGYGDVPLSLQPKILTLLDASRTLGITLSQSNMMSPLKSVTAFIGLEKLKNE